MQGRTVWEAVVLGHPQIEPVSVSSIPASDPDDPHCPRAHVFPSQLHVVVGVVLVAVRSAWQMVFAVEPVQELPVESSVPLIVIFEYVVEELRTPRQEVHAEHCVVGVAPLTNASVYVTALFTHVPALQSGSETLQGFAQPPQFNLSRVVSTHLPLQFVQLPHEVHTLPTHVPPGPQ